MKLAAGSFSQCPLPREAGPISGEQGSLGNGAGPTRETPSHREGREARPALCASSSRRNCLNLVVRNLHPASSYGFTQKSVSTKKRYATPKRTLGPRHGLKHMPSGKVDAAPRGQKNFLKPKGSPARMGAGQRGCGGDGGW